MFSTPYRSIRKLKFILDLCTLRRQSEMKYVRETEKMLMIVSLRRYSFNICFVFFFKTLIWFGKRRSKLIDFLRLKVLMRFFSNNAR